MGDKQDDTTVVVMDEGDAPATAAAEKEKSNTTMFLYKAWNDAYDEHSSLNDCMIMDEVADKDRLINSYMISNNPSPFTNSYYPQYHVVEFIVFNVKAKKAFECIKTYLTHNRKLESKYSRHYGFRLTKRRTCVNSYSTSIELIFTYPRKNQQQYSDSPLLQDELKATAKKQTSVYSFLQASGLSEKCRTDWSDFITACKPYEYINKSEFLKLLNTHCGGCFALAQEYPRFCAFVDEWKGYCSGGESTDTAAAGDDDESTTTTHRRSSVDGDIRSRRSFAPPHPSIGLRRTGSSSADAGEKASDESSVRPSSTAADAEGDNQAGVVIDDANDGTAAKERDHKYYLTTGFMQHSICGLHKQTTVARDIHKNTHTLMFHKRDYDSRGDRDIVHSHDYMMSHNPGKDLFAAPPKKTTHPKRAPKKVSPQKRKKKNDKNSSSSTKAKRSKSSKTTAKVMESSSSSNEDTSSSNNTDNEEY